MEFLFCQFLMFMYLIYVELPFHGRFLTFVMHILNVFIARMGLLCKQIRLMPWMILILYYMDIVNRIISITIVSFLPKQNKDEIKTPNKILNISTHF